MQSFCPLRADRVIAECNVAPDRDWREARTHIVMQIVGDACPNSVDGHKLRADSEPRLRYGPSRSNPQHGSEAGMSPERGRRN